MDKNDLSDQNDHLVQTDDQLEHSNHNNDYHIIDNLSNIKDVQITELLSSLTEDTSALNTILIPTGPSLSISSMAFRAPQDRCAPLSHECLFVDCLSEEEPKKVSEALKHHGWVDAMQEELNQFARNKVYTLANIIGNPGAKMLSKAMTKELSAPLSHECLFVDFLSEEEPKKVSEALKHHGWVDSMQEKLNQFARNKVYTLVPAPYEKTIIGSK
nr:hypothetical protein [Tanacetum cinerariifolium]